MAHYIYADLKSAMAKRDTRPRNMYRLPQAELLAWMSKHLTPQERDQVRSDAWGELAKRRAAQRAKIAASEVNRG